MVHWFVIVGTVIGVVVVVVGLATVLLHTVPAGQIRLVTWLQGTTRVYHGPGRSKEMPLFATGSTISSEMLSVDLDVTDRTGDVDEGGGARPIQFRVSATALVSVGRPDAMIVAAANRFFSKPPADRAAMLANLLSSATRLAINTLTHDQLIPVTAWPGGARRDATGSALGAGMRVLQTGAHPLVAAVRAACVGELADLGLELSSFNVTGLGSELMETKRRQLAAEAQAESDIAAAAQGRRAKEAQIEAARAISEMERQLEQTRAANAVLIAQAAVRRQEAESKAEADKVRVKAQAAAEALRGAQFGLALDEAIRITKIAAAQAEGLRKVGETIREGGESYFRYRLIEMLPEVAPAIAQALAKANLPAKGDGAGAADAIHGISDVVQSVLASQLAAKAGVIDPPQADGTLLMPAGPSAARERKVEKTHGSGPGVT